MLFQFGFNLLCSIVSCIPRQTPVKINDVVDTLSSVTRVARQDNNNFISHSSWNHNKNGNSPPIVSTKSGWIEGYIQKTIKGRPIAAFEGIYYAKSPSGKRRFRKPEAVDRWVGIKKATRRGPACLQMDFSQLFRVHGRENCLHLSVYSPLLSVYPSYLEVNITKEAKDHPNLPVLVFFHGGGFQCGSGSDYGPAYLLDKDVILVVVNYRLGVLGFFSTGDDAAPGNWAMKDQTIALFWVKNNIKNFGGDASSITIFGESAGAASVGLHIVSPLSDGLFHKAICESASAFTNWAIQNDTIPNSKIIARMMICPTDNSLATVSCLRNRDPNAIVAMMINTWKYLIITRLPFGPVIESPGNNDSFLIEAPEVMYSKGKVKPIPMIMGFNKNEGAIFAAAMYLNPLILGTTKREFKSVLPYALGYDERTPDPDDVSAKISQFYLQGQSLSFYNRREWIQLLGDRTILQGTYYGLQYHSSIAPTYGYMFSFQNKLSLLNTVGLNAKDWGVSHFDELLYIFNSTLYPSLEYGSKDYVMSEFILNLWTNFARTGKPVYVDDSGKETAFWRKISDPRDIKILKIDRESEMIKMPFKKRLHFWENLFLKDDHVLYPINLS